MNAVLSQFNSFLALEETQNILRESLKNSAIWCCVCFMLHFLVDTFSPFIIPRFSKLPPDAIKSWNNRATSTIHALVLFGRTVIYWATMNPSVQVVANSEFEALSVDLMMGYLWYDIAVELFLDGQFDIVAHHGMGLASHLSTRLSHNRAAAFYTMLVYIAEGSTPFLHISWILHQLDFRQSIFFFLCSGLLILTFFVCRICLGPYMVWHLFFFKEEWGKGNNALYIFNFVIVSTFALLNYYWFYKLLLMALGLGKKRKENKEN